MKPKTQTLKSNVALTGLTALTLFALTACSGFQSSDSNSQPENTAGTPVAQTPVCPSNTEELEASMTALLTDANSDYDFTYQIERADGRQYVFNWKGSTPQTERESASTSKMVTGMVIMRLVEKGVLRLSDYPQDYISDWPIASTDSLYGMTLEHLLSFRSGLTDEPLCVNSPSTTLANCVRTIATTNAANGKVPGAEFYYSGTHMQVAGLMAMRALGKTTWAEVFAQFQSETGLFPNGRYDLPSATNPRLAGGMHWTGAEYLDFLRALKNGKLLSKENMALWLIDRTPEPAVQIVKSPAIDGIGEDWHYALGSWHECLSPVFNCTEPVRISSPGAYGAYPFWDRAFNYIGMLSIQTDLGGFRYGTADLERRVTAKANEWASCQ